jgi:hypothetical protein
MTYDNTNTGLLKKNERKEKDSHPDYNGSVNVEGVDYWLSAWVKVGREGSKLAGQKYFSLALTPKDEQQDRPAPRASRPAPAAPARRPAPAPQRGGFEDMDDDIPF